MIYLDSNATTAIAPEVKEEMLPFLGEEFGNPSSIHAAGSRVRIKIEDARESLSRLVGASEPSEIVFTSGATESNNAVILSALKQDPARNVIVTTEVEHSSVKGLCQFLETEGFVIRRLGVSRSGALDLESLERALGPEVALVSVMWANNETGVIFPVEEIAKKVKARNILFHTDAAQAVGKVEVNLSRVPADFLSLSAHKFYGPKGIGALFVRKGVPFRPLIRGGYHEQGRRAGTENVIGIAGLGAAAGWVRKDLIQAADQVLRLRDRLENGLCERLKGVSVNGAGEPRLPNTTNLTVEGVESEALLLRLSDLGVAASGGAACLTGAIEPSHVLLAMGRSRSEALSSIRLSLSRFTRSEEIEEALEVITRAVNELREFSKRETRAATIYLPPRLP